MKNCKTLIIISLLIFSTGVISAQKTAKVEPEGTWAFTAQEAPYEYSKGNIVISKDGKELQGNMVFSEYHKVKAHNMALEGKVLTFKVYIEGESVNIKSTLTKDEMQGTATYSEGSISFTAKRKP